MKRIALFFGSRTGNNEIYKKKTLEFSNWILENKYPIVYGGSSIGLMGILADNIIKHNGDIIGVMPKQLADKELSHKGVKNFYITKDMHERKKKIFDLADAFVALPGGAGTMDEIVEMITWSQIGIHNKPCAFYKINSYYDTLKSFLDHMTEEGFMFKEERDKILITDSLKEIKNHIEKYD